MKSIPWGPRGISRNELSQKPLKNSENAPKNSKNSEKKFQHCIYISKFGIFGTNAEN
jgi:hypothetical protein